MNILFLLFVGLDKHTTSEHLLTAIIEQLCKNGHKVHIIQKDMGGDLPHMPECLSSYSVSTDAIQFSQVKKNNFFKRYLAELKYLIKANKYLLPKYDAVFVQSSSISGFAVMAIKKRMPKTVVTINVQDIFPHNAAYSGKIKENGLLFKMFRCIQRKGYDKANHIITISDDMKQTLVEDGTKAEKIDVIYNWSYQDHLYKELNCDRVSHMFQKDYYNVVYAGNIGVMQNVDIILEAARMMKDEKDIWFHIIGDGIYKDKLVKTAQKNEVKSISFWPMQPPELAPAIYSMADVNIIPLGKNIFRTALPSKTATCLACGKPIIFAVGKSTKIENMLSQPGCCFTATNDAIELRNTILTLKENSITSCNNESTFYEFFSKEKNSRQYAKIIVNK